MEKNNLFHFKNNIILYFYLKKKKESFYILFKINITKILLHI